MTLSVLVSFELMVKPGPKPGAQDILQNPCILHQGKLVKIEHTFAQLHFQDVPKALLIIRAAVYSLRSL